MRQYYWCNCCEKTMRGDNYKRHKAIMERKKIPKDIGDGPSCPICRKKITKANLRRHLKNVH